MVVNDSDRDHGLEHAGEQWAPSEFRIGWHEHDYWEFYLQVDGESVWEDEQRRFELGPNHFLAMPPDHKHRLKRASAEHHFYFAAFDLEQSLERYPTLWQNWLSGPVHTKRAESMVAPFRRLVVEVTTTGPHLDCGVRQSLDWLTLEATRQIEQTSRVDASFQHPAVARARKLMDEHPGDPWTVEALARLCYISPKHLSTLFREQVGQPPHQYLTALRIRSAKESLRYGNEPITEIAHALGFSSSQHFATAFKTAVGKTPREYRRGGG